MSKKQKFLTVLFVIAVLALAAGCSNSSNSSDAIQPQPGAVIFGNLVPDQAGSNASIKSGGLQITVSSDGKGISQAIFAIDRLHCTNETGDASISSEGMSTTVDFTTPVEIKNGQFTLDLARDANEKIVIEGSFTSPTEATATVIISATVNVAPAEADFEETFKCDYGTMTWSGIAQ